MRRYYHKPHAPDPRQRHPRAQSYRACPVPRYGVRVNPAGRGYSGLPTNTNCPRRGVPRGRPGVGGNGKTSTRRPNNPNPFTTT